MQLSLGKLITNKVHGQAAGVSFCTGQAKSAVASEI
jgi:hypothetical protein